MSPPILVVYERANRLVAALEAAHPEHRFIGVDRLEDIQPSLEALAPEVVFCIKTSSFLGPELRALVNHSSIRWLNVGGSGTEHLGPWDESRVTVTHSAGVLAPFLAETWVGAVLSLEGGLLDADRAEAWGARHFRSVRGQRLLLVGLGEIGSRVANLASALGMEVEAIRAHPERGGASRVFGFERLDDRLGEADIVSLHLRLRAEFRHLFDRSRLRRIKPGALFVNTARGGLVDETALIEALQTQHLRGAYLDVFEREPLPSSSPLWRMEQVLITPHAADQAEGWDLCFVPRFLAQLERFRRGEPLSHQATSA